MKKKNIIVTGTSRGIGYQMVPILADAGHNVLALSRNDVPISGLDISNCHCFPCDITDSSDIEKVSEFVKEKWQHVDILINNSGYIVNKPFHKLSQADFKDAYEVNVFGLAAITQAVLPFMNKNGHVVNISSMGGIQGSMKFPGLAAYSSSKGAVLTLTEVLAEEYKELFKNKKVREALSYAFDFEWTNTNLFYDAYKRTNSFFENSELAASGLPEGEELKLLNQYKNDLPAEVFNMEFNPPKTDGSGFIRKELAKATSLLEGAGWELNEGKLINKESRKNFEFEILLVSPAFERIVLPFKDNLEKLGIFVTVRTIDSAQYQQRLETFDFDMVVSSIRQSLSPGNEQRNFWGSDAADTNGSRNIIGIKNPVIDSLIEKVISAKDREDLIISTKALDRVLLWNHYVIPQWHISSYRTLYWDIFDKPKIRPKYSLGTNTWWVDSLKASTIDERKKSIQ